MAPGLFNQQVGVLVFDRSGKGNAYTADSINDFFECAEVDVDIVIDQNSEVVKDGNDEWIWVVTIESAVDSTLSLLAIDSNPEVTWK